MDWFILIKRYYDNGQYTSQQVAVFVQATKITSEEYEAITGSTI